MDSVLADNDVVAAVSVGHSQDEERMVRVDLVGGQDCFLNIVRPDNHCSLCKDCGNHRSSSPEPDADVFANKYR